MDCDWYTAERQIQDRLTDARTRARSRCLKLDFIPEARRHNYIRITITRLVNCASAGVARVRVGLWRALTHVRAATRQHTSTATEATLPPVERSRERSGH